MPEASIRTIFGLLEESLGILEALLQIREYVGRHTQA
jgi:hypothetical protein